MSNLLTISFLTAVILGALAAAMPLLLAALGEFLGERSGVLNLGIEGVMLIGAYTAFTVALSSGQLWLGYLAAVAAALVATVPMMLAVTLGLNQIVVGLAVFLAGLGITSVLHEAFLAETNPRISLSVAWLAPFALLLAFVISVWLRRSMPGLRLTVAGLNPRALDVAGYSVSRIRLGAVLFGGATAGLGGAYLSLNVVGSFTPGMTHGVGFLAIIVVMLARTRVSLVVLSSLLFGLIVSLGTASQLTTLSLPTDLIEIVPFVLVMLILSLTRFRTPAAQTLGNVYTREAAF
jgi:simple sugar transport system permease protein